MTFRTGERIAADPDVRIAAPRAIASGKVVAAQDKVGDEEDHEQRESMGVGVTSPGDR